MFWFSSYRLSQDKVEISVLPAIRDSLHTQTHTQWQGRGRSLLIFVFFNTTQDLHKEGTPWRLLKCAHPSNTKAESPPWGMCLFTDGVEVAVSQITGLWAEKLSLIILREQALSSLPTLLLIHLLIWQAFNHYRNLRGCLLPSTALDAGDIKRNRTKYWCKTDRVVWEKEVNSNDIEYQVLW